MEGPSRGGGDDFLYEALGPGTFKHSKNGVLQAHERLPWGVCGSALLSTENLAWDAFRRGQSANLPAVRRGHSRRDFSLSAAALIAAHQQPSK